MAPTLETPPHQRRDRLGYCAAVLGLLAKGLDGARVVYKPTGPLLLLEYRGRRVLALGLSGRLAVDNQGDFSPAARDLLNNALTAIGRPEFLYEVRERGWAVKFGPHQGPAPLGLTPEGRVAFLAQWPPLDR